MFTSVHVVSDQSVPLCHQGYESTESGEVEFVRRSTRRRVHKDPIIDESGTSDTEESEELDDREEDIDEEDDDDNESNNNNRRRSVMDKLYFQSLYMQD